MAVLALQTVLRIKTTHCYSCGCVIGMEEQYFDYRVRDHKDFYCPNGHCQAFVGESDVERAERLLREEQERHKRTLARENEATKARADAERKLRRVHKGVCPECKRSFANLAAHMKCKHGK